LGDIAQAWKHHFHGLRVAAITGSNGKTTTKEMASSILSLRNSVLKNSGNLNNLIGLPLSLLRLNGTHNAAVVELGMNEFGEIRRLADITKPDIAAITNIGRAHLERLGNIEGVARAKGELVEDFNKENVFVVNMDDPHVKKIADSVKCEKISYGINSKNVDLSAVDIIREGFSGVRFSLGIKGEKVPVRLKGIGLHNIMNSLCAAGVALSFGCFADEIKDGLERFVPVSMRLEVIDTPYGFRVINDAYNSNPESMRGAIEELMRLKENGRAVAVLGDMLELGDVSELEHKLLGQFLSEWGVDLVITLGRFGESVLEGFGKRERGIYLETHDEAAQFLIEYAKQGDLVLIKGSRGMKMENIIQRLYLR
jgi:UDP-N-acetylmuramoyl-tripeptide--D-alanyl-D-alanine ligase